MSLKVAGINIPDTLINAEYRIGILERIITKLVNAAPPDTLPPEELKKFQEESMKELQAKYPDAGIGMRG